MYTYEVIVTNVREKEILRYAKIEVDAESAMKAIEKAEKFFSPIAEVRVVSVDDYTSRMVL